MKNNSFILPIPARLNSPTFHRHEKLHQSQKEFCVFFPAQSGNFSPVVERGSRNIKSFHCAEERVENPFGIWKASEQRW